MFKSFIKNKTPYLLSFLKEKNSFSHFLLLVLASFGLVVGVTLVQNRQNLVRDAAMTSVSLLEVKIVSSDVLDRTLSAVDAKDYKTMVFPLEDSKTSDLTVELANVSLLKMFVPGSNEEVSFSNFNIEKMDESIVWTGNGKYNRQDIFATVSVNSKGLYGYIQMPYANLVITTIDQNKPNEILVYIESELAGVCSGVELVAGDVVESDKNEDYSLTQEITVVDVLIAYTSQIVDDPLYNYQWMINRANADVTITNQSFSNSGALTQLNIVGYVETQYESESPVNFVEDLIRLQSSTDGYMDDVHMYRNYYNADIVILYVLANSGGRAYLNSTSDTAFGVVGNNSSGIVFAHEVGHIFGASHDLDDPLEAPYTYGHAFRHDKNDVSFRTVLSSAYTLPFIYYFSTPNRSHEGVAMGSVEKENNARVIRIRRTIVASFKDGGGGPPPFFPPGAFSCEHPWSVVCNNGWSTQEPDCDVQSSFINTWPDWNPGGGYGRWQYEACQAHGGVGYSACPGDTNPIRSIEWCVTMDCPNGDTNGDGNCTIADQGGNTQATAGGTGCPIPNSGYGDINVYADPPQGQAWNSYCGTIFKNLTSSQAPNCSSNNYQPRFRIKYLGGNDEGWVSDGSYDYGSSPYSFENYEHAVFLNGDPSQLYNGPVRLTINGTTFDYPNGNIRSVIEPWQYGTYKIAAIVDGQVCQEKTITIQSPIVPTSTPVPTPTLTAPAQPQQFNVNSTATTATLSWSLVAGVTNYRIERCTNIDPATDCSNFSQIATVTSSSHEDTGLAQGSVYRYRVRAYNGLFSPYTPIINSSVSWTINAVPVCNTGPVSPEPVYLRYSSWPPSPLVWIQDTPAVGSHTLSITSTNSWESFYIQMRTPSVLRPVGNPEHLGITYAEYFNPYTWMAKLNRRPDYPPEQMLPPGVYTIQYEHCLPVNRVFVTSITYNGNLAGLSGADNICTSRASASGLSGRYNAWLSTSTVNAKDRIADGVYAMVDGTVVASNKADLTDGVLNSRINLTQNGHSTSTRVWSATDEFGNRLANNCNNWTTSSSGVSGSVGHSADPGNPYFWTRYTTTACNWSRSLYCFQDPSMKVFVTSTQYKGNLGGLSGADSKCQAHANSAGLTGTYRAWVSNNSVDARNRIPDAVYALVNGTVVANSKAELTSGMIASRINRNQWGQRYFDNLANVWTGTYANGTKRTSYNCNNWTSSSSSYSANPGRTNRVGNEWTYQSTTNNCNQSKRLYCFQVE